MPNLLDLIKNDSGLQELLANAGAMAKGAARGVTTDLVGAPVDLSNLLLGLMAGKGFEGLAKEPVGGSKSIRKATGQPAEDTAMEAVGNLLTAVLPSPHSVALPAALYGIIGSPGRILGTEKALAAEKALQKNKDYSGVYRGAIDNKLRTNLSDAGAKLLTDKLTPNQFDPSLLSIPITELLKLPDMLYHPKLFDAYPELKEVAVGPLLGASGAYNPATNSIRMGANKNLNEYMSTLLHEVQHAVQSIDNFEFGGNPNAFLQAPETFQAAVALARNKAAEYEKLLQERYTGFNKFSKPSVEVAADPDYTTLTKFREAQKQLNDIDKQNYSKYRNIAGEAEARAVQAMYENDLLTAFIGPQKVATWQNELKLPKQSTDPRDFYDVKWEDLIASPMRLNKLDNAK